jgi:hypothetical protein
VSASSATWKVDGNTAPLLGQTGQLTGCPSSWHNPQL